MATPQKLARFQRGPQNPRNACGIGIPTRIWIAGVRQILWRTVVPPRSSLPDPPACRAVERRPPAKADFRLSDHCHAVHVHWVDFEEMELGRRMYRRNGALRGWC